jgi:hypothetical protein
VVDWYYFNGMAASFFRRDRVCVLQFIAVIGLALVCVVAPAYADKRVALVIGNSAYRNFGGLANPKNDAADVPLRPALQGDQICRRSGFPSCQNAYPLNLASFRSACIIFDDRPRLTLECHDLAAFGRIP